MLFAVIEGVKLRENIPALICVIVVAALLVWNHRANIVRLAKGEENKLGAGKKNG